MEDRVWIETFPEYLKLLREIQRFPYLWTKGKQGIRVLVEEKEYCIPYDRHKEFSKNIGGLT